jgi:hypothetical protein
MCFAIFGAAMFAIWARMPPRKGRARRSNAESRPFVHVRCAFISLLSSLILINGSMAGANGKRGVAL